MKIGRFCRIMIAFPACLCYSEYGVWRGRVHEDAPVIAYRQRRNPRAVLCARHRRTWAEIRVEDVVNNHQAALSELARASAMFPC